MHAIEKKTEASDLRHGPMTFILTSQANSELVDQ